jgi:hypothetical protein
MLETHTRDYLLQRLVLWITDNNIIHRNILTQNKPTCPCTQMFVLCEDRTRDLLRIRRPLHQIGRHKNRNGTKSEVCSHELRPHL